MLPKLRANRPAPARVRFPQGAFFQKVSFGILSKLSATVAEKWGVLVGKQAGFHSLSTGFSTGFPTFYCFSIGFPQAAFFAGFVPFVLFFLPGRAIFTVQCFCRLPFLKNFGAFPFPKSLFLFSNPFVVIVYPFFTGFSGFPHHPGFSTALLQSFPKHPVCTLKNLIFKGFRGVYERFLLKTPPPHPQFFHRRKKPENE